VKFEILARDGAARAGRLTTAHGVVDTPVFMPVGTRAAVKSLTPDEVRRAGLPAFRSRLARLLPWAADRVKELANWDQVRLLTVQIDRLKQWWRPGLLCIGDAAHAMSPVGGVGINLAIQDAVATANLLAAPLRDGQVTTEDLRRVQQRREWPTSMTQRAQLAIQNRVIRRVLTERDKFSPPFAIRLLALIPFLRRIPARMIGLGFRPEHVHTPDTKTPPSSIEVVSHS